MRFFTTFEILNSVLLSILTGVFFACIYAASESIVSAIHKLLFIFHSLYAKFSGHNEVRHKNTKANTPVLKNISEMLLFLFFGVCIILLLYLTLDGVFRLYILIIVAFSYAVGIKTLGKIFKRIFDLIFEKVYSFILTLLYYLLLPVYKFTFKIKKNLISVFIPLVIKHRKSKSKQLTERKKKEVIRFFS